MNQVLRKIIKLKIKCGLDLFQYLNQVMEDKEKVIEKKDTGIKKVEII